MPTPGSRADPKPGPWRSLLLAAGSWRTLSVTLLSFSSGLPLGLVWIAIPDWMAQVGIDIRIIGLTTLAHAPWTFKMLWSPLMDRYAPPGLGRRRGWILVCQVALFALTLALGGVGHPDAPWVILALASAIAVASASKDIVIDAYAVEVLRPEERGIAVGARIALYRLAMQGVASLAIWITAQTSWAAACLFMAAFYVPMAVVAWRAPEAETPILPPRSLRESVWLPFLGALARHRALEILAFVFFYKFADQLAQSLQRPFFEQAGYSAVHRGLGLFVVGLAGTVGGTFLGGALTTTFGLVRCLWVFGVLQILTNLGYILLSRNGVSLGLFYSAMTFETVATGLGMGAFGVLLLAMTQRRFSATQYALFSSLFAVPRLIAGPVTGAMVHSVGWTWFFVFTMVAGIPGLVLLARFAPWGTRELEFDVEPPRALRPLSSKALALRGVAGGVAGFSVALAITALLEGLNRWVEAPQAGFELVGPLLAVLVPKAWGQVWGLAGSIVFGLVCGLGTAAIIAARHGAGAELEAPPPARAGGRASRRP